MRVLITGAAGFIGSHLADAFLERGDTVTGIDNLLTGRRDNFPGDLHVEDVADRDALYGIANQCEPELVVHCAASYSNPDYWHRDTDTNITGTINATLAARHHGAHLVYPQTVLPPTSSYAISKIAGERFIRLSGVDATVLRLANVVGPRNLSGAVPAFYKRIVAGEGCTVVRASRDFVYVGDLVRLVLQAVDGRVAGTFTAATGREHPIVGVFLAVAEALGRDAPDMFLADPSPDEEQPERLDPSAAWETFGWQATTPLRDAIAAACRWYDAHGIDAAYTHLRIPESETV